MLQTKQLNILLLCDKYSHTNGSGAGTIVDHIEAFENYSSHRIWLCSGRGEMLLFIDPTQFDVIVLHYSLYLPSLMYLGPISRGKVGAFQGLKIAFVQDEYRRINNQIDVLSELGIDVLFTCFNEQEAEKIYTSTKLPNLRKVSNLTGYIPKHLLAHPTLLQIKDRKIDVGYRARKPGFWLGELSFEKSDIVKKWLYYSKNKGLKNDVSYNEEDRIYGDAWIDFIKNCKVHLGVESGASIMDFTGEIEQTISKHMEKYPNDDFYKVQDLFLKDLEGLYKLNQISPRIFEAIALKTGLVLYEGEYSNILEPWRHYIPLKKDFSNFDDVITKIKDDAYLQVMVDRAYDEIAINPKYSYQSFIKMFDDVLDEEFKGRKKNTGEVFYSQKKFNALIRKKTFKVHAKKILLVGYKLQPILVKKLLKKIYNNYKYLFSLKSFSY